MLGDRLVRSGQFLPRRMVDQHLKACQGLVGAKLKFPVRRASGRLSRQRTQGGGAARGDARLRRGQPRREWVALVTDRRHGTVPAVAVPSVAVVPLTSG